MASFCFRWSTKLVSKVTFILLLLNHEICTQTRTGPRTKAKLTEPTSNLEKITKHLGYAWCSTRLTHP